MCQCNATFLVLECLINMNALLVTVKCADFVPGFFWEIPLRLLSTPILQDLVELFKAVLLKIILKMSISTSAYKTVNL